MEQKCIKYKKYRPHTAKLQQIQNRPKSNIKEKTNVNNPIIKSDNPDFRGIRPFSSNKDKVNNRHWENNDNHIKNKLSNPFIDSAKNRYNKSLYKIPQVDWGTMKKHNFLLSVGGSEVDTTTWLDSTNSTNLYRPLSSITNNDNTKERPATSTIPIIDRRLDSARVTETYNVII